MPEKQRSLLTPSQRGYLQGEEASNESQMRGRIRDRVYNTFRNDASVLLHNLSADERRKIFREWEDEEIQDAKKLGEEGRETYYHESMEWAEKGTINIGITALLAFLYLGVDESNLDDFGEILEAAVKQAAQKRNQYVSKFEFSIELEDKSTGEEIYHVLENGEIDAGDLTLTQLSKVVNSQSVNWRDLPENQKETIEEFLNMRSEE
jgi:hypothetical protein